MKRYKIKFPNKKKKRVDALFPQYLLHSSNNQTLLHGISHQSAGTLSQSNIEEKREKKKKRDNVSGTTAKTRSYFSLSPRVLPTRTHEYSHIRGVSLKSPSPSLFTNFPLTAFPTTNRCPHVVPLEFLPPLDVSSLESLWKGESVCDDEETQNEEGQRDRRPSAGGTTTTTVHSVVLSCHGFIYPRLL